MIPAIQATDNNWTLFKNVVENKYRKLVTLFSAFIFFTSTLLNRLCGGPFFKFHSMKELLNCRKNSILGLLTFNNYVDINDMCMEPTWILSVELHLTLVGFALLFLLVKFPSWKKIIIGSAIALSVLIVSSATYINGMNPIEMVTPE